MANITSILLVLGSVSITSDGASVPATGLYVETSYTQSTLIFLTRDAMHKRDVRRRTVSSWVSVSLSVTFVYCAETVKDTAIVAMECEKETVPKLSNGTIFNDRDSVSSKIMPLFDFECLRNGKRQRRSNNGILTGTKGPFIATQLNSTRRRVVDTFTA